MKSISEQINDIRRELAGVKPRSQRRVTLETKLCMLRTQQLKREIRAEKRKAA